MVPAPHQTYSQELSSAFRRGHPIANPQPVDYSEDEQSDEEAPSLRPVEIGDVGYIQQNTGLFIRLFNVHLEPGVDGQPAREGLPPDGHNFRPLRRGTVSKTKDTTPVFVSQSVETVKLNATASGPFFGGSAGFSASSKRGAILATPDPIECRDALNIPSYIHYAKAHIKEWHAFYSQTHQIDLEDLILVTGVDRTTSWATAVFSNTKLEAGFGLDVQFVGAGGGLQLACQYSWRSTFGALVNAGPLPRRMSSATTRPMMDPYPSRLQPAREQAATDLLHDSTAQINQDVTSRRAINTVSDQTLFIRHIRAKRRPWRGMKLEARGEKDGTDDDRDDTDNADGEGVDPEGVVITSNPEREQFADCLEPVLDYILENSDSDIAIAHDQDLDALFDPATTDTHPLVVVRDGIGALQRSYGPLLEHTSDDSEATRVLSHTQSVETDNDAPRKTALSSERLLSPPMRPVLHVRTGPDIGEQGERERDKDRAREEHKPTSDRDQTWGGVNSPTNLGVLHSSKMQSRAGGRRFGPSRRTLLVVSNPSPSSDSDSDERGGIHTSSRVSSPDSASSALEASLAQPFTDSLDREHVVYDNSPMAMQMNPPPPSARSVRSPYNKTIILVSSDAEYFSTVHITGFQNAAFIKELIFAKLQIPDEDCGRYSIFKANSDAYATGGALSDDEVYKLCVDEGDSKGSLRFLVGTSSAAVHKPAPSPGLAGVPPPPSVSISFNTLTPSPVRPLPQADQNPSYIQSPDSGYGSFIGPRPPPPIPPPPMRPPFDELGPPLAHAPRVRPQTSVDEVSSKQPPPPPTDHASWRQFLPQNLFPAPFKEPSSGNALNQLPQMHTNPPLSDNENKAIVTPTLPTQPPSKEFSHVRPPPPLLAYSRLAQQPTSLGHGMGSDAPASLEVGATSHNSRTSSVPTLSDAADTRLILMPSSPRPTLVAPESGITADELESRTASSISTEGMGYWKAPLGRSRGPPLTIHTEQVQERTSTQPSKVGSDGLSAPLGAAASSLYSRPILANSPTPSRDTPLSPLREPYDGGGSAPDYNWVVRPNLEDIVERLEQWFPNHDVDKPVIESSSGEALSTSTGAPDALAEAVIPIPASVRRGQKKSIRVVAEEHKQRIVKIRKVKAEKDDGQSRFASDVAREGSTKFWDSNVEEITPEQIRAGMLSITPESAAQRAAAARKLSFKWIRGDLLGKGNFGRVYLAMNVTTGEIITVKQFEIPHTAADRAQAQQANFIEALKLESETLKSLNHPNIVQYLAFEETPTFLSIFMEYVPGGSVGGSLEKHGAFDEDVTKSFTLQVLEGLEYLHSKGVLHRDIRADNILVGPKGICKITEFGVSKRIDDVGEKVVMTAMLDNVLRMAPEVINAGMRGYNSKADIWSVGYLVLQMWSGERPWREQEAMGVFAKWQVPSVPQGMILSELADEFRRLCFALNPDERPSAAELKKHPYLMLPPYWTFTGFTRHDVIEKPEKP